MWQVKMMAIGWSNVCRRRLNELDRQARKNCGMSRMIGLSHDMLRKQMIEERESRGNWLTHFHFTWKMAGKFLSFHRYDDLHVCPTVSKNKKRQKKCYVDIPQKIPPVLGTYDSMECELHRCAGQRTWHVAD